ncbi:hypothetical protein CEXT_122801 [Caerostris extrusa]|uniref:Uncharacterized protein n=1 Tax=Caerostris extrusa TaxID=172846 RepID=A0AAV4V0R2_CAEEX|nr:hypothetical protein CEXT_122801 [Caerostris extrusa]
MAEEWRKIWDLYTLVTPSPWKRIEGPTYLVACQPLRLLMPVRCPLPSILGVARISAVNLARLFGDDLGGLEWQFMVNAVTLAEDVETL